MSAHCDLKLYEFAKEKYEAAPMESIRPKLLVTGRDLIAAGYPPGPEFKTMLEAAEDAQLEGTATTTEEGMTGSAGAVWCAPCHLIRSRAAKTPVMHLNANDK